MTKQEQIYEMAKIVDEMYNVYTTTAEDIAEGIYNAGYRKIDEFEKRLSDKYIEIDNLNRDYRNAFERLKSQQQEIDGLKAEDERLREVIRQLNTEYNRAWERLKSDCREIGELKAENRQLKTECALLDDELRIARQDTIDVLNKVKEKLNNTPNGWAYTTYIDELINRV